MKKNLKELRVNRIGILLDNADSYNVAVEKTINLLDVSDKLVEVGNPQYIKEDDRKKMLDTFKQVRADLIRAIKTDRIWRENPNINPQDFQIPVTPAAARYELSEQAKEYQQMVDEAMKISSIVQEQMEMMRGVTNDKKDNVVEQLSIMRQKSLLCGQLERRSLDEHEIQSIQTAWSKMSALNSNELELGMNNRFASALFLARQKQNDTALDETTLANRKSLCIRMEILAEIPSPSDDVQRRSEYLEARVKRLSEAVQGKVDLLQDKVNEAQETEKLWYLAESVPEPYASELESRFDKARNSFYSPEKV